MSVVTTASQSPLEPKGNKVSPEVAASLSIKKEILNMFTPKEMEALTNYLENVDNRFRPIYDMQKSGKDSLIPKDVIVPEDLASQFSRQGLLALKTIIAAYGSYLAPFAKNVEETEPFTNLLEYLTSPKHNWDMVITLDKNNYINGGSNGRQLTVDVKGQPVRAAWIEHTWTHPDIRNKGLGTKLYQTFEKSCETNPQCVFIEIDNPRALTKDEAFHTNKDLKERERLWVDEEGQSMDPYNRIKFWGKQGFRVIAMKQADGKIAAAPYVQICMDPTNMEEGGFSETMFAGLKVKDKALLTSMDGDPSVSPELYKKLYAAIQGTIDENLHLYPEWARTQAAVDKVTSIVLLDPRTDDGLRAVGRLAEGLDEVRSAKYDKQYCEALLKKGGLDEDAKEIVEANLKRANLTLADVKETQATASTTVQVDQPVTIESLKGQFPSNMLGVAKLVDAYHVPYSTESGYPLNQQESVNGMLKYLATPRVVSEGGTKGSFNMSAVTVADETSPIGKRVVGGAHTADWETTEGKTARVVEQIWGAKQSENLAEVMANAKKEGFPYLVLEGDEKKIKELTKNLDQSSIFMGRNDYVQPSMTANPNEYVTSLKHVWIKLDPTAAESASLRVITNYYADWAEGGAKNPAVEIMRRPLVAADTVRLYPMTDEGMAARQAEIGSLNGFLYQQQIKRAGNQPNA
jgi:GNAT superfamily N-acetyltransferase